MPGLGPSLIFAGGLAIGVGAGVFLPRKAGPTRDVVLPPSPPEKPNAKPVQSLNTAIGPAILQGGFPGEQRVPSKADHELIVYLGPIPDVIKRTAYTAAYDRKHQHPAWVSETAPHLMPGFIT
jgi:endonuclease G